MARPLVIPAGTRFGRLVVVEEVGVYRQPCGHTLRRFLCRCDCGKSSQVDLTKLRSGNTRSCGCLKNESIGRIGHSTAKHGMEGSPTYRSWQSMLNRCRNPNDPYYASYGGRGISVCRKWQDSFESFLADMGERPADCTIDRIDNDSDYTPENCRWATMAEQNRNKRDTVQWTFNEETMCVAEWERKLGMKQGTIHHRRYQGWTIEECLTIPVGTRRSKK